MITGELTENTGTKRILIPSENLLTPESLNGLLMAERARRESQIA
jgi:hypothetical protein